MVKPSCLADEFKQLYLGLAVLWTVAAPGSDFVVAVLPPVCAFVTVQVAPK